MSAEVYGAAEITGQSQEKSGDSNSPGLEDSDGSMTAKHGQHQGKEKGHTIKTPRMKTSEKSQIHGTADTSGIVIESEDIAFPVKRGPLGVLACALFGMQDIQVIPVYWNNFFSYFYYSSNNQFSRTL